MLQKLPGNRTAEPQNAENTSTRRLQKLPGNRIAETQNAAHTSARRLHKLPENKIAETPNAENSATVLQKLPGNRIAETQNAEHTRATRFPKLSGNKNTETQNAENINATLGCISSRGIETLSREMLKTQTPHGCISFLRTKSLKCKTSMSGPKSTSHCWVAFSHFSLENSGRIVRYRAQHVQEKARIRIADKRESCWKKSPPIVVRSVSK